MPKAFLLQRGLCIFCLSVYFHGGLHSSIYVCWTFSAFLAWSPLDCGRWSFLYALGFFVFLFLSFILISAQMLNICCLLLGYIDCEYVWGTEIHACKLSVHMEKIFKSKRGVSLLYYYWEPRYRWIPGVHLFKSLVLAELQASERFFFEKKCELHLRNDTQCCSLAFIFTYMCT